MSSDSKELKYSYDNLSDDDKLAVDTAVGRDKYEELSSHLKKTVLVWNTGRQKGLYWVIAGLATGIVWAVGLTFRIVSFFMIPYQYLLPIAVVLIVAGIFLMFRRIYIHF